MQAKDLSYQSLITAGALSEQDFSCLDKRRGLLNKIGFAYQLMFVKLSNTLPQQNPFEIIENIVSYACIQLEVESQPIELYGQNRK